MDKNTLHLKPKKLEINHFYGTFLAGTAAHEFGHWFIGKRIYKCNGLFYITPIGSGGTCHYYNTTKEVLKAVLKKNIHYPIKQPPINPFVVAAGPLFGIGFNLAAPIINTLYYEYKQKQSVLDILKNTAQQSYINDKQNFGFLLGTQFSLLVNLSSFSPFRTENDGYHIAKYFNINCHPSKLGTFATTIIAASIVIPLYLKTLQTMFPDDF